MIGVRVGPVVGPDLGTNVGAGVGGGQTTLTVALSDSTDPVINVVNFDYSVVVTNTGANSATNVVAVVTLDASLTFVSGVGTGWAVNRVGQAVTCTRATLAPGAAPTITITVTTADSASTASTTADADSDNSPAATQDTETTVVKLVARDSTSLKRFPASLTQWQDFNAYHVAIGTANFPNVTPASVWLMQEASGNLADSIGSITLTQTGAGHLYQQTVTGHTRKAVQTVDGTAGQKWTNSTTAPNPNTTDTFVLSSIFVPAASPAANRDLFAEAAAADVRFSTAGKIRAGFGASADLTVDARNGVRRIGMKVDNTNSVSAIYTDQEKFIGTYALPASGSLISFGGQTTNASGAQYLYAAQFTGASARLTDANVKALYGALGDTITWS